MQNISIDVGKSKTYVSTANECETGSRAIRRSSRLCATDVLRSELNYQKGPRMAQRRQLGMILKGRIIGMLGCGRSQTEVSQILNVPQ